MKLSRIWSYQWISSITVVLILGALVLRTSLIYSEKTSLIRGLSLLAVWLAGFLIEKLFIPRSRLFFVSYIAIQASIICVLLLSIEEFDYFALLFSILSMQVMERFESRKGIWLLAGFTPLIFLVFSVHYKLTEVISFTVLYSAANFLFSSYSSAARRTQEAGEQNKRLSKNLQAANYQIKKFSAQVEQLAVVRERNRLARELHDSVTQTIFSMTLNTQATVLLLEKDIKRVAGQLEKLNQLAQSAQIELQQLMTELVPVRIKNEGLLKSIQKHIDEKLFLKDLKVDLKIEGDQQLKVTEEQGLFRIIQEALNNIVKHARTDRVHIHLHLMNPLWVEVKDEGCGFELQNDAPASGIGLSSMRERANEIGWELVINSSPGGGTRIRVQKIIESLEVG